MVMLGVAYVLASTSFFVSLVVESTEKNRHIRYMCMLFAIFLVLMQLVVKK